MQQALRTTRGIKPWMTITLGELKTPVEYRQAIKARGMEIGDWALGILSKVQCSRERNQVSLVMVPVGYFGFQSSACCEAIFKQAAMHGLELCPPEVGLALMLQYPGTHPHVPRYLLIAMDAIPAPTRSLRSEEPLLSLFRLERKCGRMQLHCLQGYPNSGYPADAYFIFVRP